MKFLSTFFLISFFTACTTTPTAGGAKVKIADSSHANDMKKCKFLTNLSVETSNLSDGIITLKNEAAKTGANIVLSRLEFDKPNSCTSIIGCVGTTKGIAYKCPASIADSILSADTY